MEEWRSVPGWEGFYEVSDLGRVRSVPRTFVNARGHLRSYPSQVLAGRVNDRGRLVVTLFAKSRRKTYLVHQLVALAFVGPCPEGKEVCHGNGDRTDNRLTNLRYDTHVANMADATLHGTLITGGGRSARTHCPRRHLLRAPNLMPSQLARGRRVCLACQRGRRNGRVVPELADAAYVKLGFELEDAA